MLSNTRPDSLPTQSGAFISVISCSIITLSFLWKRKWRRYPNPLIYWKAVVDLLYALRFQFSWDGYTNPLGCRALATLTQFCIFSSECWFLCMSYNLYQCSTNPFTNLKHNLKWYHSFSWSVGMLFAALLWLSSVEFDPKVHPACFVDETVANELIVYYVVVILAVLCAVIFAVLETQTHPFKGMKEALKAKKDVIRSARIFTVAYIIYQIILISFWAADVLFFSNHPRALHLVRDASSFFHAAKGLIDLVIWVAINGSPHVDCRSGRLGNTFDSDRYSDVDIDLQPQLNVALRKEVLHFTTRGIVAASSNTPMVTSNRRVVHLRLHELGMTVCFDDYSPSSFRDIRQGFGINEILYRKAFLATCHERLQSGGSSGAFMFYTADYAFLVKTVTTSERNVLLNMLPAYIRHMKENPESHLTRFYGCHSIEMYGQVFNFVVMGNVIGRTSMHQFFDIKGSWIDRNATALPPGKTVICTYCSHAFRYGTNESCEYSIRGIHLPHIVLKDNDFHRKLRVESDIAEALVCQLENDSNFLREQGIMDYSLLLSVHNTKYVVEHCSMDTRNPSPTKRKVNYPVCHPESNDSFLSLVTDSADQTDASTDEDLDEVECGNRRKFNRNCRYSVVGQYEGCSITIQNNSPLLGRTMRRCNSVLYGATAETSRSDDKLKWIGKRTLEKRGYQACVVAGPDFYTLGVVDMLQTWTWTKRLERLWKTIILRHDGMGISAAPPKLYAERFQRKMRDILMVPSVSVTCDPN
ncbi:Phosphatidylinositol 4-phosphate 5-kinase (PIPK-D3/GPCR-PIPK/PiGK3) [Plasmopara halstedii]|uniref:Phosphatidylinositol 4-phosphate 5-kinase (PIPK-D3/GPCR-PIPK/PiGK3) n=1 Tax=Plasmopara halstedii TaxID=4781 RepID=A0A0P1ANT6_PLAHL|nr:Phosphatidylinositol 4-phosphate 5-kinase (PIPK-D3/GPCR-PIPK/PiGK3) [Plasmopara halstedii]CEG43110.1 Phosphatidylinositol 4-phosphate 5-kinase (PIPK-D3/GPCR-PIPK/PiGK3) [Plasmopara halstedii]|eukprot:XP_024579479.1 Phosphatidylinositol 4-phosphate 5-kinase (PIPK-D3/GPCR-PIPK/PiGK3) [Plasmopara halstedii]